MADKENKKKKENKKADGEQAKLSPQAKSIMILGCALLLIALVLYPGENVWTLAHNFFKGIFGVFAITLPALLMYIGIITAKEKKIELKNVSKMVLGAIAVILLSNCVFLFGSYSNAPQGDYFTRLSKLYTDATNGYKNGSATGILGGLLGYPLAYLFGFTASKILCIVLFIVDIMFMFGITVKDVYNVLNKIFTVIKNSIKQCDFTKQTGDNSAVKKLTATIEMVKSKITNTEKKQLNSGKDKSEDDYIDLNEISDGFNAVKTAKQEKAKSLQEDEDNSDEELTAHSKEELLDAVEQSNSTNRKASILDKLTAPESDDEPKGKMSKKQELAQAEAEISKQISENQDTAENTYCYPPIELLYPSSNKEDNRKAMEELERNGTKLESTLKSFGVNANIVNICRGPSVTRFEVQPAPGVKISKITNLSDDIALNLASSGVRIEAPIPGKAAVGIEVPNKVITMVSMRELIDSSKFKNAKSKLSVVLGKDISGNTIVTDLSKMPHLLIAGTTGSGKSVCVNSILISLLYKATPDEVKLLLIDPKMVEFSKYKGIPHLLIPVVTDPKKAAGALNWAVNEMENRYKIFSTFGVRDIGGYNTMIDSYNKIRAEKTPEELEEEPLVNDEGIPIPNEKMASIVIAIDEFADLMMTAPNEVEDSICRLAQKARAAGMHLVVATQRPTVNVITGVIKANIPSRISLKVSSQLDSRTILDVGGAEKLIGRGDMLFAPIGAPKPTRVQGCYASDAEIENVTAYIKKDHSSQYNVEIQEEIEKITEQELTKGKDKDTSDDVGGGFSEDSMMEDAIKLVVENGQASTSLLQRRLRLGYARAGRLIDEMEQMGIVGPHVGSKSREVLMTYQQWLERKNNMSE